MKKKRFLMTALAFVLLLFTFQLAFSTTDPLITESYLRDVFFNEVKEYIAGQSIGGQGQIFQVVSVEKGKTFVGAAGCEFILRQGSGTVIASDLGGLSDVTAGVDLPGGTALPPNHHLIIARDDGRGFIATQDVLVMVKGGYRIQ